MKSDFGFGFLTSLAVNSSPPECRNRPDRRSGYPLTERRRVFVCGGTAGPLGPQPTNMTRHRVATEKAEPQSTETRESGPRHRRWGDDGIRDKGGFR